MSLLAKQLTDHELPTVDTLLVIGAGTGANLPMWRSIQPRHLILIEPHPGNLNQIRQRIDVSRGEEVWPHAILAEDTPEATLHTFNNPLYSSVRAPYELEKYFPNLCQTQDEYVPSRSLKGVLQSLRLSKRGTHALILDTPGIPYALAKATPPDLLQAFTWIEWHDTVAPLYQDAHSSSEVADLLHGCGFDLEKKDMETLPPETSSLWHRNDARINFERAKTLTAKQAQLLEQLVQIEKERDRYAELADKHRTKLDKSLSEFNKKSEGWRLQIQKLTKEQKRYIARIDEYKKALEIVNKQLKEQRAAAENMMDKAIKPNPSMDKKNKFGGDANIDDFILDIAPFFYNRSITYVDVGAYIGEVFLKLHHSDNINIREAHLFEPNKSSLIKLRSNIAPIKLTKLNIYNHALGSGKNKDLYLSAAESMSKIIGPTLESDNINHVDCYSLDSLTELFTDGHINLLKIDVEGYEKEIIDGASKLLESQNIDVIYIEVGFNQHGTQQTYFCTIDSLLQRYGYRAFGIYEQKNEWIQDSPLLRRCNFAYMSKNFATLNPYKTTLELMNLKQTHN